MLTPPHGVACAGHLLMQVAPVTPLCLAVLPIPPPPPPTLAVGVMGFLLRPTVTRAEPTFKLLGSYELSPVGAAPYDDR